MAETLEREVRNDVEEIPLMIVERRMLGKYRLYNLFLIKDKESIRLYEQDMHFKRNKCFSEWLDKKLTQDFPPVDKEFYIRVESHNDTGNVEYVLDAAHLENSLRKTLTRQPEDYL